MNDYWYPIVWAFMVTGFVLVGYTNVAAGIAFAAAAGTFIIHWWDRGAA